MMQMWQRDKNIYTVFQKMFQPYTGQCNIFSASPVIDSPFRRGTELGIVFE